MPSLIGWVGPRYKRWNNLGNNSNTCRKSCAIQFHAKKKVVNYSHIWTISNQNEISTSRKTLSHISLNLFSLLFIKNTFYTKNALSNRDYFLLIYTFICRITFLGIIILSFQSHHIRILNAGMGMACNREGLSCISRFELHIIVIVTSWFLKMDRSAWYFIHISLKVKEWF